MKVTILLVTVFLCGIGTASAQEGNTIIGAAVGLSMHPHGSGDRHLVGTLGGTSISGVFFGERRAGKISVGGEWSAAGDVTGEQAFCGIRCGDPLDRAHRDSVISGMVKRHMGSGRLRVAAGGGAGVALRHYESHFTEVLSSREVTLENTDVVFAATGGIDFAARFNSNVALLAVGRFHFLFDDDGAGDRLRRNGVSPYLYRFGAGLVLSF